VVSSWRADAEVGVTVADTGSGIPADASAHVFDRFYRADPSRSRESGGSGLGLAICYEIMAAHGGRIWVRSEQGHGSAFSIALPLRPVAREAPPPEAPPPEAPPPEAPSPAAPSPERQPSAVSRSAAG
jgi:signal transduction histidine kinase